MEQTQLPSPFRAFLPCPAAALRDSGRPHEDPFLPARNLHCVLRPGNEPLLQERLRSAFSSLRARALPAGLRAEPEASSKPRVGEPGPSAGSSTATGGSSGGSDDGERRSWGGDSDEAHSDCPAADKLPATARGPHTHTCDISSPRNNRYIEEFGP